MYWNVYTWEPDTFVLMTTEDVGVVEYMLLVLGYGWWSWFDVEGCLVRSLDDIVSKPGTCGDKSVRCGWGSAKFSWITGVAWGMGCLGRGEVINFSLFPWLEYNTVFTRILAIKEKKGNLFTIKIILPFHKKNYYRIKKNLIRLWYY